MPEPATATAPVQDLDATIQAILSSGQVDAAEMMLRSVIARERNDAAGFEQFYYCIYGRDCPRFALDEWIPKLYQAREAGKGLMLEAWRGSTKSTIMQAFCWYQLGHNPTGSGVLVGASDDAATKMAALMATVIEFNDGWKACFPNVQPDKDRGWGASGYFVKDAKMPYTEFTKKTLQDHGRDPSFVGAGITSSDIVGKHPSVFLLLDDIHDENNTRSEREMDGVKSSLTANLLPTMSRPGEKPFIAVAYTPWKDNDAYAFLKNTELLDQVRTPVVRDGVYAWPQAFGEAVVEKWRRALGALEFARMFLCDLAAAQGVNLKREWLHYYPQERINPSWPVYFGIDFASTADRLKDGKTDYFCLAVVRAIPMGGLVVVDGVRDRMPTGEAFEKVKAWAAMYPGLRTIAVEKWGKGEEFFNLLRGSTSLPIIPMPIKGTAAKSKGQRFEKELAPMFEYSRVWLTDADNAFVKAFVDEWVGWPNAPHDDTLDSVYWACMVGAGHLMPEQEMAELPMTRQTRRENPFNSFGRH